MRATSRTRAVRCAATAVVAVVAGLLSAPASVSAQYPSNDTACTRHYKVQSDDTCDIIGQKTFTSTYQIMALNLPEAGPNCYTLEVGHNLCLGTYGNDCQLVHRAHSSETCNSIAADYDISVATLKANNPSLDCGQVYDGLVLCVTKGLIRPPAEAALNMSRKAFERVPMPLGEAITATNDVSTTSATVSAPASSAAVSAPASSATVSAPASSSAVPASSSAEPPASSTSSADPVNKARALKYHHHHSKHH